MEEKKNCEKSIIKKTNTPNYIVYTLGDKTI